MGMFRKKPIVIEARQIVFARDVSYWINDEGGNAYLDPRPAVGREIERSTP